MEIGTRIKQLRTEKHLSQEALANALHLSRQAVTKWENNTSMPSTANLIALCSVLGVSLEEITSEKEPEPIVREKPHKRMRIALLTSSIVLAGCTIVAFLGHSRHQPPPNSIGYADAETSIFVTGTPLYLYVLCGLTGLVGVATLIAFLKAHRAAKEEKK